jgi:hypothetical protein
VETVDEVHKMVRLQLDYASVIDLLLRSWSALVTGIFQRKAIILLSHGILWGIWTSRNKLIFENKKPIGMQCLH